MPESLGRRERKNLPLDRPFNSENADGDGAVRNLLSCLEIPWKSGAEAPRKPRRKNSGFSPGGHPKKHA